MLSQLPTLAQTAWDRPILWEASVQTFRLLFVLLLQLFIVSFFKYFEIALCIFINFIHLYLAVQAYSINPYSMNIIDIHIQSFFYITKNLL